MDVIGDKVLLRATIEEDAPTFARVLAAPEMTTYLGPWSWVPYGPREALEYVRREPGSDVVRWTVVCRADGQVIGATGLHRIDHRNRHCIWGVWIGPPDRWDQGFGTEACRLAVGYAFLHLGLEKVILEVYDGNARARRTYEKAGFVSEGILRRHMWLGGRLVDVEEMAVFSDHPLYSGAPSGDRAG